MKQKIEGEMKKGKEDGTQKEKRGGKRERGTLLETDNKFRDIVKHTYLLYK